VEKTEGTRREREVICFGASKEKPEKGIIVSMAVIHISEAEAADDFAGLMARVRAGEEIVIESDSHPVAIIRAVAPPRRSISESIALAEARSKELGYKPVMDAVFAADMEEIIRNRKPRDTSAWD
jgi:antitoxin (DNA-binding transcriptional repressor) of toxin-antitoxin stability system